MDMHPAIYLDYNATTPVDPAVVNEMLPYFLSAYGNPSSNDHILGWQAKEAIEEVRESIAKAFDVVPRSIIFTSGATESINLALRGFFSREKDEPQHLITLETEHKAVLETCQTLAGNGVEVTYLPVDDNGLIDVDQLAAAIQEHTKMVCIMMVNNETGVMQDMTKIAELCRLQEVIFMSDTTQAIGKIPVNPATLGIDILVGSAHKFYGPMGVGFLYLNDKLRGQLHTIITGGAQEWGKRAGTLNVPGIVGMGKALEISQNEHYSAEKQVKMLRDTFEKKLNEVLNIRILCNKVTRIYNTSNIVFYGVDSERLMQAIGSKIAASRGSACSSTKIEPSHMLTAMGVSLDNALSAIRFSFGRYSTEGEVNKAVELIVAAVTRLKPTK